MKHTFEETSRSIGPVEDCHVPDPAFVPSPDFEIARAYTERLASFIMKMNPKTFQGALLPEYFCFHIEKGDRINATAFARTGRILVYDGAIKAMPNDAEYAALLAHELSHITMNHVVGRSHPLVASDREYQDLLRRRSELESSSPFKDQMLKLQTETTAPIPSNLINDGYRIDIEYAFHQIVSAYELEMKLSISHAEALTKYREYENQITDVFQYIAADSGAKAVAQIELLLSQAGDSLKNYAENTSAIKAAQQRILGADYENILRSWQEQEADEVGYELYLRAGFKADAYAKLFELYASAKNPQDYASCVLAMSRVEKGEVLPLSRGSSDHPSDCWRASDITITETEKHKDDYSTLLPKAIQLTVFPDELTKVKESLGVITQLRIRKF